MLVELQGHFVAVLTVEQPCCLSFVVLESSERLCQNPPVLEIQLQPRIVLNNLHPPIDQDEASAIYFCAVSQGTRQYKIKFNEGRQWRSTSQCHRDISFILVL